MTKRFVGYVFAILLCSSAAGAQVTPASAGITVVGRGVVRVHADELRFSATIFPTNPRGQVVVDVDAAAFTANGPRVITGSLRNPTREAVDTLVKRGNAAAAPFPGVTLQNVGLGFLVDDCSAAETRAQEAALADARARADRVARAAGVRLGSVIGVNEGNVFGPPGVTNCATKPDTSTVSPQRVDGDPATGDVYVGVTANVTFAIAP